MTFLRYERSVIDTARNLVECTNGTAVHMSPRDFEMLSVWLRWRISEAWTASRQPRTLYYDSLVRVMAGEALDIYEMWAKENGLRDAGNGAP